MYYMVIQPVRKKVPELEETFAPEVVEVIKQPTVRQIRAALRGVKKDLVDKFIGFHKDNPDVFELFYEKTMKVKETGRSSYSAWVIANLIRWEIDSTNTDDEFKINNNFIGLYARLLMSRVPELKGFFNIRKTKS